MATKKSSKIKELDDFYKAYDNVKKAEATLNENKKAIIKYLQDNELKKHTYKGRQVSLCEKKSFTYTDKVEKMSEALSKQKELEELSGDATIKSTTDYIRLSEVKNDDNK